MSVKQNQMEASAPRTTRSIVENDRRTNSDEQPQSAFASLRDVVESLVFALFLAFLIKTFEVEAYVIPTGSMAPTLKGRHKDIRCEQCGYTFQLNASSEIDERSEGGGARVVGGTCPQCGYVQYLPNDTPSFTGDRILVSKAAFDFRPLKRWDVSVFRAPSDPKTNYIKRIVGLPNERVKIEYGDIFVQKKLASGDYSEFEIVRKPLNYLNQMLQTVHDNDYPMTKAVSEGWPSGWVDELTWMRQGLAGWIRSDDLRSFAFSGKVETSDAADPKNKTLRCQTPAMRNEIGKDSAGMQWLRYRHIVPLSGDWVSLADGRIPDEARRTQTVRSNPRLVTDFAAYNSFQSGNGGRTFVYDPLNLYGLNWTGDLALFCTVTFGDKPFTEQSELVFELVRGEQEFRCRVHPLDGRITLEIPGVSSWLPETAIYRFRPGAKYRFQFMNIDEQMRLVVNRREIVFPNEGKYDHLCQSLPDGKRGVMPRDRDPGVKDLVPASIGARAVDVRATHLCIKRDIYYLAVGSHVVPVTADTTNPLLEIPTNHCDRLFAKPQSLFSETGIAAFLSNPPDWQDYGKTRTAILPLGEGQYLALGDNSRNSEDSRKWDTAVIPHYVDRKYLIGKAFYVYWPHGLLVPGTQLPLIPNVTKMRHID